MSARYRNILALLLGLLVGLGALEVGLRTVGHVRLGFWPGKTTVKLTPTKQGVCYAPGGEQDFPYDARLPDDRDYLKSVITGQDSSARYWSLERTLDETPRCLLFDVTRGRSGAFPGREVDIPVLGDSFAFGEGLDTPETLWTALGRAHESANFPNFSFRGAGLVDISRQLEEALAASRTKGGGPPPQVLYFYNLNDIGYDRDPALSERMASLENETSLLARFGPSNWLEELLARSAVYWVFARREMLQKVSAETTALYRELYLSPDHEALRAQARKELAQLQQQARAGGTKLSLVIYPLLTANDEGEYLFSDLHAVVLNWCADLELQCADATDAIFSAGPVDSLVLHPEDRHPNAVANRAVAEFVHAQVLPAGMAR